MDVQENIVKNETEVLPDNELNEGVIKIEEECEQKLIKPEEDCEQKLVKSEPKDEQSLNLYSYIDRDYTSEIFKIEIRNLPKFVDHGAFLAFLRKNEINFSKAKVIPGKFKREPNSHAYVTLKSAQDRVDAIAKLDKITYRGSNLSVQESSPLPDPCLVKRRDNTDNGNANKRQKSTNDKASIDENFDTLPIERQIDIINTQVAPFWNIPYEEQLEQKAALLQKVMKSCFSEFIKIFNSLQKENEHREEVRPTLDFFSNIKLKELLIRSPVINGYRNKCEFNIGFDRTVGFRLGLYKEGTIKVVQPPDNCPIISEQMHQVVNHFQQFLKEKSKFNGFNPMTHEGHFRQILVRTTIDKQCLISVALYRQDLTDEQIATDVIEPIKQHFADNACGVCSVYVQILEDRKSQASSGEPKHVNGETHIREKLMNGSLQFRISPMSFFQINTAASELLYSKVIELAACKPESTVLDICCGTGTIGLCFARSVRKVIGLELNEDAIKDARFNAELNQITNIEFHCGRAEKLISSILNNLNSDAKDVVAILDPPRNGLPATLIKAVRNNEKISRLIYVSCEAKAAQRNFIDLCRPKSKAYYGRPFIPRTAVPVDLFPNTDRCELILLFERA